MFSDPQFWVAVAFFAFIAAIFNPVRKILATNLDTRIKDIKDKQIVMGYPAIPFKDFIKNWKK